MMLSENERWLLSYYRSSEIAGSLFFGQLARALSASHVQSDMTKHYADEAQHAWFWTRCLAELDSEPLKVPHGYQDGYLEAAGVPANLMEVLAVTLVFERRVINQYAKHLALPGVQAPIADTIRTILEDERWHVSWVSDALDGMREEYGDNEVHSAIERCRTADREVYAKAMLEYDERLTDIFSKAER